LIDDLQDGVFVKTDSKGNVRKKIYKKGEAKGYIDE